MNSTPRILEIIALKRYIRMNTLHLLNLIYRISRVFNFKQLFEYFSLIQQHSDIYSQEHNYFYIISKERRKGLSGFLI